MSLHGQVFANDPEKGASGISARSRLSRITGYLKQDIRLQHADLVLLVCGFISGLCDSGTFNAWSCFVSMQTGNTIFLGLGASGLPLTKSYGWLRSLIAIISFLVGCFSFSLMRHVIPRSRGMLSVSFVSQGLCLTIAAVLVQVKVVPDTADGSDSMKVLIPLVFLGFQAGGQVWTSEVLGFKEIPTTVLTSVFFGLASDVKFISGLRENPARNRRLGAVCALLLGAISGGWLCQSRAGIPVVFFVAAGLKYFIATAWLVWSAHSA
ncbi:uncharacterized protein Z518_09353 [Rhinocladiella mackenziei CBS 650.93]|uniref:Rhinocladiella mackenziei CBS 650.93 unplaced genomic scaffold supercont1.7, whole genome shotgun sequence n=1 Tax=Rhinocladiella mackenziei CBS 650.93 TaxID=1442369 RepID=A0A0D2FI06_9EURO|nr:uncharacterized protein Z518_09353 [Rhinocladiella mackenziei CBS 650.93]KIX01627.1 hypothetical protein Z518_09353 [Rhinocladiella mackenziei CBS 650.93]